MQHLDNTDSNKRRLPAKFLVDSAVALLLGLALVYLLLFVGESAGVSFFVLRHRSMDLHQVSSILFSRALDGWVWSGAIVLVSVRLFYLLFERRGQAPGLRTVWALGPIAFVALAGSALFGLVPLALASVLLVCFCFAFSDICLGVSRHVILKHLVLGTVAVVAFVEALALVLYNIPVVLNLSANSLVALHWRQVELSLSNIAYPLLPYEYLALIILGVAAYLVRVVPSLRLSEKLAGNKLLAFGRRIRDSVESCKQQTYEPLSGRIPLIAVVTASIVLSSLLVAVTVLPWINPTYRIANVDGAWYYPRIMHMRTTDPNSAISWAFSTDRPAFFSFMTLLSYVIPPLDLVHLFAALLIPLFVIVSLLLLRLFCPLREALVYTALLAPFSITALGLLYSGYFANMLAVILVYFYFILLVKVFRSWSTLGMFALLGVSVLVLFTHLGTWFVFAVSLGAFLLLEWRSARLDRGLWKGFKAKAAFVGATVIVGLAADFVRQMVIPWSTTSFVAQNVSNSFGFPNVDFILNGLKSTTVYHLGGAFANAPFILLSIVGLLFLASFKSEVSNLLLSWIFVSCVYMLFGSGMYVFNRLLFMLPVATLSGLGLSLIVRRLLRDPEGLGWKKLPVELLLVACIVLLLVNLALGFAANLNAL